MPEDRPYIEIEFTGTTLTQYRSNTFIGTDIVIDYGDGNIVNYNGDYSHDYSENGTYTIRIYGVTSLGRSCFRSCSGLTNIVIPDSVTSLGDSCFSECSGLTNIVIPNSITSLGDSCFSVCYGLTSIVIPDSVTSLGSSCFSLSGLTSIVIPDSVTSIGNRCFSQCFSLTSVVIPDSITSLGVSCFEGCSGLTSVVIPDSVTSIGNACFYNCSGLTNVIIPDSVISIGNTCFRFCSSLTSVVIPDSVTNLGDSCFQNCYGLTSIIIADSVTSLGENCFYYCTKLKNVQLNWTSSTDILTYNASWINSTPSSLVFTIPYDTTSLYEAKGYPTVRLKESSPHLFTDVKTLFLNNKEVKSIVINEPNGGIIYERATTTNLTIEVPALVYSDTFNVTGLLTDENNNPISNASIKLYRDNNILEATETTDSNGEVTFQRDAPTEIETYTFQLIFEGNKTYNNSSSSIVSRTVEKETSILNITSPLNNSNINEGDGLIITGNLNDNDATPIANKTIVVKYEFDFIIGTGTTDSNGNFTIAVDDSNLKIGNNDLIVDFSEDDYYTRSNQTISINVIDIPLTLVSNKDELSAKHNESAILTATYIPDKLITFNGPGISTIVNRTSNSSFGNEVTISNVQLPLGEAIYIGESNNQIIIQNMGNDPENICGIALIQEYSVGRINNGKIDVNKEFSYNENTLTYYNDNEELCTFDITDISKKILTTSSTGFTVTSSTINILTDSNGQASVTYNSQGAGDVTITATCKSKQATCSISDYPAIYIDNCDGTQKQIFTTTAEGGTYKTFSYTTYGGYQCLNHNTNFGWYPPSNSGNMLIEFDMYPRGSWGGTSIKGANGTRLVWYMQGSQYNDMNYPIAVLVVPSQWNKCKILIQDGVVTAWLNNNQIGQTTTTITHPFYDEMGSGTNPCYIKNLKIIELP